MARGFKEMTTEVMAPYPSMHTKALKPFYGLKQEARTPSTLHFFTFIGLIKQQTITASPLPFSILTKI